MNVEARTGFGCDLVVAYDTHIREAAVKVFHIRLHSLALCRRPGVFGVHRPVTAAGIDDMTADGVVAFGSIGDFPRIDIGVLVVIYKPLDGAVEMDDVGITDLLPPPCRQPTPD